VRRLLDTASWLLGLGARAPAAPSPSPCSYLSLHEGNAFTVGIFCVPPGGCIPLHDHPGMTVASRLLYGRLHVRALDWAPGGGAAHGGPATLTWEGELDGAHASVRLLHPAAGGNLHAFTARTACAVLDVLGPPYDATAGRPCTYYAERALPAQERGAGASWLTPVAPPPELVIRRARYTGTPLRLPDERRRT
jgi:cysteamine dioxygenase